MAADRPIILTGAASGIGRAAAEQLAAKSHVLALVDTNTELLNEVVARCQKISPRTRGFSCDVTDQTAVARTYRQIREEFGGAATLINCAGIGKFAPFLEIEPSEWVRMFHVNVMGAVLLTRAALPDMLAAGEGLIINVSSRMALDPHPATTAYAASKAALLGFSKALAMEVKDRRDQSDFPGSGRHENEYRHAEARRLSRTERDRRRHRLHHGEQCEERMGARSCGLTARLLSALRLGWQL